MGNLAGFFIFSFFFFFMLGTQGVGASQDDCMASNCSNQGPAVRFPFWLRDHQSVHCGYPGPGFILYCSEKNDTVLELPFSVKLFVENIDYKRHLIHAYDPNGCLPKQLPNLDLSASPFQYDLSALQYDLPFQYDLLANYTLFSCPSPLTNSGIKPIPCLSFPGNQVHAIRSEYPINDIPLSSCSKLSKLSYIRSVPYEVLYTKKYLHLNWSNPLCGNRQAAGKSTETKSECFDISERSQRGSSHKLIITGANLGFFLIVLVVIGVYFVWNRDKIDKENQVKIEKFLEDYKALKPTRYSYADIKRITHQFKDKLGQGGHGTVYKGNLSDEIFVAVKILNFSNDNGEEFINEVGTMGTIHHVNVVRLVGFCADGFRRALVYEFLPNDSLEKLIFKSSGKANSLGWEKLQDIALGIAKGIEYLHQGCDQRILHFDIKPHNILLDHNFNPKISDFGLAKLCSKEQSIVSMTTARGTMGYIAPEVFSRNFGSVSYKSDVYSFGMVLLEMVGGRKNTDTTIQNTSQVYFPEWIYNRLDHGEEIEIQIEEEQDSNIARKLAIVGLWCIQWYPVDRPSMRAVVQMLEGDGESLTIPPNPFASTNSMKTSAIMHGRPPKKELEAIVEIE